MSRAVDRPYVEFERAQFLQGYDQRPWSGWDVAEGMQRDAVHGAK